MYASVATGEVQPGKMEEFLSKWRESVKPMVEGFSGLETLYVLSNAETNKVITIALYETKADAERTQTSGDYKEAVSKLASTVVLESLVREAYEVSIKV